MDKKDAVKEWFKIAESDLSSAAFLQKMRPTPVEIICYHCQQAAEKYLKGFLALKGLEIQKTHDLALLNKICKKYNEEFKTIEDECLVLTDYSINVRYPFPMDINESDMKIALRSAQKIKDYVLEKTNVND